MKRVFSIFFVIAIPIIFATGCKSPSSASSGGNTTATDTTRFWEKTSGPLATDVFALAASPSGIIYAGIDSGVARSTDSGMTWTPVLTGDTRMGTHAIAVDSTGSIYAGTSAYSVQKSYDGVSWVPAWNPSPTGFAQVITSIQAHPSGAIFLNMVGYGGPFRSTDGGTTFTSFAGDGGGDYYFYIDSAGIVYYIYLEIDRSTDVGATWQQVPGFAAGTIYGEDPMVRSGANLWAGGEDGIYHSTDDGATSQTLPAPGNGVNALTANRNGVLFAGTYSDGVYRSTNNGADWVQINGGLDHTSIESMIIDRNGYLYVGTEYGGVYRSITSTVP